MEKQSLTATSGANKLMEMLQNPNGLQTKVKELVRVDNQWLHRDNVVDENAMIEQAYKSEKTLRDLGEKLFTNWLKL